MAELEAQNQGLALRQKALEHELKEAEKFRNAVEFLKEEVNKAKSDFRVEQLQSEKLLEQTK